MIEHLNYSALGDREVFITWNGSWYRLPFFVLDGMVDELEWEGSELDEWIQENRLTHNNDTAIPEIKRILEPVMPEMEAYKLHGQPAEIEGLIDGEYKKLKLAEEFASGTLNHKLKL